MTRRYHLPQLPDQGGVLALSEEEASHAAKVMRVKPGERVAVFDGRGRESQGVIAAVERRQVYVELGPAELVSREPLVRVTLAVSLPKGDRAKVLIEKLTELGVARLAPIQCQRTQGKSGGSGSGACEKLHRYVVEACKQCGRNRFMEILPACDFENFIAGNEGPRSDSGRLLLIAHPGRLTFREVLGQSKATEIVACVGPEGGFTDGEVSQAISSGFQPISLGKSLLRVETAATAIAAKLLLE